MKHLLIFFVSFLVTWKLCYWVPDECPSAKFQDAYGNYPYANTLQYCSHEECTDHFATFSTREEAEQFIAKAPDNCKYFTLQEVEEVK